MTALGHACYLIKTGGTRILTDPWLVDPIFGGFVRHEPPLTLNPSDLPHLDAIAISHAHLDHFNAPTLAALADRNVLVIHPPITRTELDTNLEALGFRNRLVLDDWETTTVGAIQVTATPSIDTLDECAFLFRSEGGSFWDGADAPQPPSLQDEIASRFGPIDIGAFGHNAFDQPALLGLPSHKTPDHALEAACRGVEALGVRVALAGASNMRWTGPNGDAATRKTIRRTRADFVHAVSAKYPSVVAIDPVPGNTIDRHGNQTSDFVGTGAAPDCQTDYIHAAPFAGGPDIEVIPAEPPTIIERLLPDLTRRRPEASRYIGARVGFRIVDEEGCSPLEFSYDFERPGSTSESTIENCETVLEIQASQWFELFAKRINWQVLLISDQLRVLRFQPGAAPQGLHPVYALQTLFP